MRYNTGTSSFEGCNGTAWADIRNGATVTAAGSTKQVQFNSGGAFGASANFNWDIANNRLGIRTATPAAPLHVAGEIIVGNTSLACSGTTVGGIRYTSTTPNIEFCDGSVWRMLAASSIACGSPTGLSFTNVTGQPTSTIVGSNIATITFSGCAGSSLLASVTGTGTAQISINGGGWTTSGSIQSGQTLQVRMTTSPSANTVLTATVTVNATSTNWTTTTLAGALNVFMTPGGYTGSTMGGLGGADTDCQTAASAAGYSGTYKAILLDDTTSAASRLTLIYPIVNAYDGSTVAPSNLWSGLLSTAIKNPSGGTTCSGCPGGSFVWSGTNVSGAIATGSTCTSWSSASGGQLGAGGQTGSGWVNFAGGACATYTAGLWCIQQNLSSCTSIGGLSFSNLTSQPLSSSVQSGLSTITFSGCSGGSSLTADVRGEPTAQISINGGAWTTSGAITSGQTLRVRMTTSGSVSTTRTATVEVGSTSTNWTTTTMAGALNIFVTSTAYLGSGIGGLAGADALCQSSAGSHGYAGTYKAILSDESTSALSRLTLSYPIIRATDGTVVASVNLFSGTLDNPICASSCPAAWTGITPSGGSDTGYTCSSWTSSSGTARVGGSDSTNGAVAGMGGSWVNSEYYGGSPGCNTTNSLYCIQQ
jgi:hypothetical protein